MFGPSRDLQCAGILCVLVVAADVAHSAPSAERVRDALEQVIAGGEYQTELPHREVREHRPAPSWLIEFLRILFWAAVAGVVAVVAFFLIRGILRITARKQLPAPHAAPRARPRIGWKPLEAAEAHARAGRFAEAVHVLWLGCIEELRAHGGFDPAVSLTSREILAAAPLATDQRSALSFLVAKVEVSLFGHRALDGSDYEECAARFRRFLAV